MKYYYAIFTQKAKAIEVEFPDLPGCVTFAETWENAIENATDVLAGWLANADAEYIKDPSPYDFLQKTHNGAQVIPIPVDEKIMASYDRLKRFNVIFPIGLLRKVDEYRKRNGLKRSMLLRTAVEEFFERRETEN